MNVSVGCSCVFADVVDGSIFIVQWHLWKLQKLYPRTAGRNPHDKITHDVFVTALKCYVAWIKTKLKLTRFFWWEKTGKVRRYFDGAKVSSPIRLSGLNYVGKIIFLPSYGTWQDFVLVVLWQIGFSAIYVRHKCQGCETPWLFPRG